MNLRTKLSATTSIAVVAAGLVWGFPNGPDTSAYVVAGDDTRRSVEVTGNAKDLLPGLTKRLDVSLKNTTKSTVTLTSLTLRISRIDKRHRSCALSNYEAVAYTGRLPITLRSRQKITLSSLGVPAHQMPGVRMLDLPTVPQDMCLGSTLTVEYGGTVTGQSNGGGHDDDDDHRDHNDSGKHRRHDEHHGH